MFPATFYANPAHDIAPPMPRQNGTRVTRDRGADSGTPKVFAVRQTLPAAAFT
jgi:hypothetical protein